MIMLNVNFKGVMLDANFKGIIVANANRYEFQRHHYAHVSSPITILLNNQSLSEITLDLITIQQSVL